jgi:hypothetical protein
MQTSAEQALARYHAAYDNTAYQAVCDELVWILSSGGTLSDEALRHTPDYIVLTNLLINVSLETCGHPTYHGQGWTLAASLLAVTEPRRKSGDLTDEAVQNLFNIVDGYLSRFRAYIKQNPLTPAEQVRAVQRSAEAAVQLTNPLPGAHSRAAYDADSCAQVSR